MLVTVPTNFGIGIMYTVNIDQFELCHSGFFMLHHGAPVDETHWTHQIHAKGNL